MRDIVGDDPNARHCAKSVVHGAGISNRKAAEEGVEEVNKEFEDAWNAAQEEEQDLEDWYERQREIRYAHAIENMIDDNRFD